MWRHDTLTDDALFRMLRAGEIAFAGNRRLRIFGRLECRSGRRMKRTNRVFFASADEAMATGYRPCGHCMRQQRQPSSGGSDAGRDAG